MWRERMMSSKRDSLNLVIISVSSTVCPSLWLVLRTMSPRRGSRGVLVCWKVDPAATGVHSRLVWPRTRGSIARVALKELMDDADSAKRARPAADASAAAAAAPPAAWPSASSLYARGLENRAEAATREASWSVNGQEWRSAGFNAADVDNMTLKQRQAEARRAMLKR